MEQQTTSYTNLYQLICPYLMWFKSAFIPKGNMVRVKGCRKVKFFFFFVFFPHLLSIVLWDTFHLQRSNSHKRATRINIWKFLKAQLKKIIY